MRYYIPSVGADFFSGIFTFIFGNRQPISRALQNLRHRPGYMCLGQSMGCCFSFGGNGINPLVVVYIYTYIQRESYICIELYDVICIYV